MLTFTLALLVASVPRVAVVIGANEGGPGQQQLRYAEDDARGVASALRDVGAFTDDQVTLVLAPDRAALTSALDDAESQLAKHMKAGTPAMLLFYFSGHARSSALSLGDEELPLDTLRARLSAMPASLKVVLLDACQSGAFSRVKGVQPARDFSINSVAALNTSGLAVIASSSGSELSQESDALGGSHFTHHLVVGLRGAADVDTDGVVSLAEAYDYAYNRTLVTTAASAVGKQHATLETDLTGKGELILSYPAARGAKLQLPEALAAEVLVTTDRQSVVADLHKAAGAPVSLSLPAGRYAALVRRGTDVRRCGLELAADAPAVLAADDCPTVEAVSATAKGDDREWYEGFALEVAAGFGTTTEDGYLDTVASFGFSERGDATTDALRYSFGVVRELGDYVAILATFENLDRGRYGRDVATIDGGDDTVEQPFAWSAYAVGVGVRGQLPLFDGILVPYVQGTGGLGWANTELEAVPQTFYGWHLGLQAGLQVMPVRWLGAFVQGGYKSAPIVSNLIEQRHDSGGFAVMLGVRGGI